MDTHNLTKQQLRSRLAEAERTVETLRSQVTAAPASANGSRLAETEKALAASEDLNGAILEASFCVVFRLDRDGTCLDYRCPEGIQLPVAPEIFLGKRVDEILPEKNARRALRFIEAALTTGQVQEYEFQIPVPFDSNDLRDLEARLFVFGTNEVLVVIRNISKQMSNDKALQVSEERLNLALDAGQMGTWNLDFTTGKMVWSDVPFRLLGLEPGDEEPSYETWASLTHPEDVQRVQDAIDEARLNRKEFHQEFRVFWPDGSEHWISSRGRFVYDEQGKAVRVHGVAADIDERKQSEEALRIREEQYRKIFDASVDGLVVIRSDGIVEDANPAICRMHGIERSELIGNTPADLVHPNSHDDLKNLLAVASSGSSYHCEVIGLRKNGESFECDVDGIPFKQAGQHNLLGIIRDISKRKQAERKQQESEHKYQSLFDNSVAGVVITKVSGELVEANEALCDLLGYSQEEIRQLNVGKLYAQPGKRDEYFEVLLREGTAMDFQLELLNKAGKTLWASFSSAMIKWQGQEAVVTTIIDISERKQAEAKYQRLVEEMNGIVFQCEVASLSMTYVSPHAEILLGYPILDWLEDSGFWASHIHPDDRDEAVRYCSDETNLGRDHAIQYRMIAADGREVWIHDTIRLVRDEFNKITHLHGVMLDITDQKRVEHDLQSSEEHFRLAAQSVSDLIWTRELTSNQLKWHGDIDGSLGYEQGEFPRTLDAYRELIHPEDYERVSAASNDAIRIHGKCSTEYRILGKDGEYRHWVDSWESVRDEKGVPIRFIGAVQDITDQKLAEREREARYRHLHVMDRINQIIVEATDLDKMLNKLIDELIESLGADRVWLLTPCDPQGKETQIAYEKTSPDYPGAYQLDVRFPINEQLSSLLQSYLDSDGPLAISPEEISDVISFDVRQRFHIKSQLGVVLRPKGGNAWLLGLHQCAYGRIWSEDDIQLLDSVGQRIEDALSQMLMQEELQERELQLARAQKVAKLGSFQSTFGDDYSNCSEELCNILELDPNNRTPSHQTLFNCLHPEDRRRFTRESCHARAGRPVQQESEYRVVMPDGACKIMLSKIEVVQDDRGEPMHLLGTLQDVTERKLAEEFLKSSEQKYRILVETSPYCIHQIDLDGKIMSMNRAGLEMLGVIEESSVIGLPYLQAVCKEDQGRVSRLLEDAFVGSSWEFEFKSTGGFDFLSTIVPRFDSQGNVDRLLGITQDITNQKRDQVKLAASEARYRSLMEDANDAIILIDADTGMLVDANQEAQEMLNRTHQEILRMHFAEIYPAEDQMRDQDPVHLHLVEGGGVLGELSVVDREGRHIPVEVSSSVIQIEDSRVVQCIYRNLTERKRIEKELQQKETEIAKVSRLSTLGELTSGIAHELNQPLTAIANYVEAIKDLVELENRDDDLIQILTKLGNTTFRTSAIISLLRGLIRKAATHRSAMNLNELIEELVELRMPELEQSHIQLRLELSEEIPHLVIDSIQIQQVLLNLIKNAQEAMENTHKERRLLTISTQHVEDTVELSIKDSGRGLPSEGVDRLFDYFFTTTPGGLGVGLQVCRTIMEAHQGSIDAKDNPTDGATFRLSFPLVTGEVNHES